MIAHPTYNTAIVVEHIIVLSIFKLIQKISLS